MARTCTAAWLAGVMVPAAALAQDVRPPTIDCATGFDGLKTTAMALPGAEVGQADGFDTIVAAHPEKWRVEYFFTTGWHPAHPAVVLRTLRKQVTGVWTAESKACGYGNQAQFSTLVDDMKRGDKELTDASRAEVARKKKERSPLAPP